MSYFPQGEYRRLEILKVLMACAVGLLTGTTILALCF